MGDVAAVLVAVAGVVLVIVVAFVGMSQH